MLDLEDVEATKVALQQAHAVAQSAALGVRFGPREQVLLLYPGGRVSPLWHNLASPLSAAAWLSQHMTTRTMPMLQM